MNNKEPEIECLYENCKNCLNDIDIRHFLGKEMVKYIDFRLAVYAL